MTDLTFRHHGSIVLLHSNTETGREWVVSHIPADALMFGDGIVIEHRYFPDIIRGASADGLAVNVLKYLN